jgi:hypothetical protein
MGGLVEPFRVLAATYKLEVAPDRVLVTVASCLLQGGKVALAQQETVVMCGSLQVVQ